MVSTATQEIVSTAAPEMTISTAEPAISPMPLTTHAAIGQEAIIIINLL